MPFDLEYIFRITTFPHHLHTKVKPYVTCQHSWHKQEEAAREEDEGESDNPHPIMRHT